MSVRPEGRPRLEREFSSMSKIGHIVPVAARKDAGEPAGSRESNARSGHGPAGLGTRIKRLRRSRRISVTGLARQADCSRGMVHRIEAGERRPSLELLFNIAVALGVDPTDLIDQDEGLGGWIHTLRARAEQAVVSANPLRESLKQASLQQTLIEADRAAQLSRENAELREEVSRLTAQLHAVGS